MLLTFVKQQLGCFRCLRGAHCEHSGAGGGVELVANQGTASILIARREPSETRDIETCRNHIHITQLVIHNLMYLTVVTHLHNTSHLKRNI